MSTFLWIVAVALALYALAILALVLLGRREDARALAGFIPDCVVPILVALVLRSFLRTGGGTLVREHWPGPERTLGALRLG